MTRAEFNRELKKYVGDLDRWRVILDKKHNGQFVLGCYFDEESKEWTVYETDERNFFYVDFSTEDEREALEKLMTIVRVEAGRNRRLQKMEEKRRREKEKGTK